MTEALEGQELMFGLDTWSGKTSLELSAPTREGTSRQSSRKSSASQNRKLPMLKCLTGGVNGPTVDATTPTWEDGAWPTAPWTRNIGGPRSGENGLLSWPTSTGSRRGTYSLTLNTGEKPRKNNPSWLSEVLEENAEERYSLSAKACQGILNRAERRGKELPPELKAALEAQAKTEPSVCKETESTELTPQGVTEPDGAGGGSYTLNTIDRPAVLSFQEREGKPGGAKEYSYRMSEPEPCPHSTIKESSKATAHAVDCRNGTEDPDVNGTLQAKESGMSLNLNNVVRVSERSDGGVSCGNPWDSQSERVYHGDGAWHSLNANSGGGQNRDAVLTAIPINTMVGTRDTEEKRTTFGIGEAGEPQFTLSAAHEHAIFAFAQNQRDEVRDLKDIAGSLAAEPGMKQQTFVAGFSFGQSEKARSLGYQVEMSPTLLGGEGGNQKPVCLEVKKE